MKGGTAAGRSAVLAVTGIWLVSVFLWFAPGFVLPDGAGYFSYLPSTVMDHDLVLFDEWLQFGQIRDGRIFHKEITATDHLGNHWTSAPAVFWLPSYLAGSFLQPLIPALRSFPANGVSLPWSLPVLLASALAGLFTLLVGYRLSRTLYGELPSAVAALGIWLGSPLMWYSLRNSSMSHAVSSLACAVVVATAVRLRSGITFERLFAAGLAAGFAFAVRPQNGPFAFVVLLVLPWGEWAVVLKRSSALILGGLIGALPQFIVSSFLYGSPWGYLTLSSRDASSPWAPFQKVWIWEPMLSWFHGLVPWTPFLALAIAGFFCLYREDRPLAFAAVFSFSSQWLINAAFERSFWGAFAFGQRRFDNCTVFFLLGAAAILTRLPRAAGLLITSVLSAWTLGLFLISTRLLDLNVYYTPAEIMAVLGTAAGDLPSFFVPLGAVPPGMRALVALLITGLLLGWLAGLAGLRLLAGKREAVLSGLSAIYLIVVSGFFFFCGMNDAAKLPEFTSLIEYNRRLGVLSGFADTRIELLKQELTYLTKSGREREAGSARRELERLMLMRRQAVDRARSRPG